MFDKRSTDKTRSFGALIVPSAAVLGVLALVGTATTLVTMSSLKAETALTPPAVSQTRDMSAGFAEVIQKVSPAVVNIQVSRKMTGAAAASEEPFEEFFKRFFDEDTMKWYGRDRKRPKGWLMPGPRRMSAGGSGFIIDPDGYIVSNDHVVGEADEIFVTLKNGKNYEAKLVGRDPKTDLALVKIDAQDDLPFVRFGDSDATLIGDWVVTLGNPFGLGHTATVGIVSARHRNIGAGSYDDFLQIDAPINKGNSGGPTFNLRGEVIGVNSAIFSPTGGNVGIGFAIPSTMAQEVIAELKENGTVERGWLGVHIQKMTDDMAESLGLSEGKGAIITEVTPDSPAAAAEIEQGDVIVAVDGDPVRKLRDLPKMIAAIKAGETAKLTIWREGKEKVLRAEIGRMPGSMQVAAGDAGDDGTHRPVLGLRLAALQPDTRYAYGIDDEVKGVVITDVSPDSWAARKSLRTGDVIVAVGDHEVSSPADVVAGIDMAKHKGRKAVLLLVSREEKERYVALPLRDA